MKRVGIITFHAAHNYGSLLQNYALQQTLINLGFKPETINFRTEQQKEQYSPFKPFNELADKRRLVLSLAFLPWKKALMKKADLFEKFLSENLFLTKECGNDEDLKGLSRYNAYIAGSDQIWNIGAKDFNWCYFLNFVTGVPKIAYAASMGTNPSYMLSNEKNVLNIKNLLEDFYAIGVREEKTKSVVEKLTDKPVEIQVDPTLLLTVEEWSRHISDTPIIGGAVIFYYIIPIICLKYISRLQICHILLDYLLLFLI